MQKADALKTVAINILGNYLLNIVSYSIPLYSIPIYSYATIVGKSDSKIRQKKKMIVFGGNQCYRSMHKESISVGCARPLKFNVLIWFLTQYYC